MSTHVELAVAELEAGGAQLLPERSAMALFNFAKVDVWQDADAYTFFSFWTENKADNDSYIHIYQD